MAKDPIAESKMKKELNKILNLDQPKGQLLKHVVENGSGIIKFKTREDLISAPWQTVIEMSML
jgi:hypothetical protein